jgi:hypothetical protein
LMVNLTYTSRRRCFKMNCASLLLPANALSYQAGLDHVEPGLDRFLPRRIELPIRFPPTIRCTSGDLDVARGDAG